MCIEIRESSRDGNHDSKNITFMRIGIDAHPPLINKNIDARDI